MKNKVYSLLLLAFCGFGLISVTSCKDDDDNDSSSCTCTIKGYGATIKETYTKSQFGVSSCKEMTNTLQNTSNSMDAGLTYSCK